MTTIVKELEIHYLALDWDDSPKFDIPMEELLKAISFIHEALRTGSILVHCAQVSAQIRYIMLVHLGPCVEHC